MNGVKKDEFKQNNNGKVSTIRKRKGAHNRKA